MEGIRMGQTPEKIIKIGNFQISVWENSQVRNDGTTFASKSLTLRKSWQKNGQWTSTAITLFPTELITIIDVLEQAKIYLKQLRNN